MTKKLVCVGVAALLLGVAMGVVSAWVLSLRIRDARAHSAKVAGVQALEDGRYDDAITLLNQSLFFRPDDSETHYGLGAAYEHLGAWRVAVKEFERAVDLSRPKDEVERRDRAQALSRAGRLSLEHGSYDEAVRIYQKGIREVYPEWPE